MQGERLQRYMARAGVASRRKCEELIACGRVSVNGAVVTEPGSRVYPGDAVALDGREIRPEARRYILINKPAGVVTSVSDPQGRPTVTQLIGSRERLFPVGRLDLETTGLLLITNDGDLAHRLMHPSFEIDKVYVAGIKGEISAADIERLGTGVQLEDGMTAPAKAQVVGRRRQGSLIELTIHEGRKRQVRRMLEAVGHQVISLHRCRYAMLTDEGLAPGDFRELREGELQTLRQLTSEAVDEER